MNYKLAKQLKEAGFDQLNYDGDGKLSPGIKNNEGKEYNYEVVYIPTLSELIDACEPFITRIFRIDFDIKTGKTKTWGAGNEDIFFIGKTKKEAVAKLWLKINKK